MSVAVGLIGFYALSGDPYYCCSTFLTDDEIRLARNCLEENRTDGNGFKKIALSLDVWKRVLFDWKVWVLSFWNIFCWCNSNAGTGCYILWLKALKRYSIPEVNQLSMITPGIGLVYLTVTALIADKFHSRLSKILVYQVFNIIGDANARAVTLMIVNIAGSVFSVWTSVVFFPTIQAPRYLRGYSFTAACALALSLWSFLVLWLYKRDERKHASENGIIVQNSKLEDTPATNGSASSAKVSVTLDSTALRENTTPKCQFAI